ncbi:hypothetical protein L3Y34_013640 [Caenorhabditis briggsae]|uniref:Uncharacterized protein n=1 Tax=Caenorhabditis briggsae TaxID=6238 RepID=A0AAE9CWJ4_CAEBR|nr:hypothetical protein L3Y34_013640 [Caenorhabditis briggsae]
MPPQYLQLMTFQMKRQLENNLQMLSTAHSSDKRSYVDGISSENIVFIKRQPSLHLYRLTPQGGNIEVTSRKLVKTHHSELLLMYMIHRQPQMTDGKTTCNATTIFATDDVVFIK